LESIPRPDDAADALAIALCHAFTSRFGNLFAVGNTTRAKGHNTVTGEAFQSMMKEEQTRAPRKKAEGKKETANGTLKTVKTPSLTKPVKTVKSVKAQSANSAAKKPTGQGVNSAAAIAKALFEKSGNGENQ
jgi:hypothetical protein